MIHLIHDSGSPPPFDLGTLVGAFPGIIERSHEEWEEFLGKASDPHREIRHWMAIKRTFHECAAGRPLNYGVEVFQLLSIVCKDGMVGALPLDSVRILLPESEVELILKRYYGYFLGD